MSDTVSTLLSSLLIRLRDPAGTLSGESGVSARLLAQDILSRTQQIYNQALKLNIFQLPFTIQPMLLWYDLADVIGPLNERITTISYVTYQNRDLSQATLDDLKSYDRHWHRRISSRLECFIPLGYTHFILWPLLDHIDTCTLFGPLTTPIIQDAEVETLPISEERIPLLIQLVELILSNRAQDELSFSTLLKNFSQFLPQPKQAGRIQNAPQIET